MVLSAVTDLVQFFHFCPEYKSPRNTFRGSEFSVILMKSNHCLNKFKEILIITLVSTAGDTEADIKAPSDVGRSKRQIPEPEVEGEAEEGASEEEGAAEGGAEEPAVGKEGDAEKEGTAEKEGAAEAETEHKHTVDDVYYVADTPRVQDGKLQVAVLVKEGEGMGLNMLRMHALK